MLQTDYGYIYFAYRPRIPNFAHWRGKELQLPSLPCVVKGDLKSLGEKAGNPLLILFRPAGNKMEEIWYHPNDQVLEREGMRHMWSYT